MDDMEAAIHQDLAVPAPGGVVGDARPSDRRVGRDPIVVGDDIGLAQHREVADVAARRVDAALRDDLAIIGRARRAMRYQRVKLPPLQGLERGPGPPLGRQALAVRLQETEDEHRSDLRTGSWSVRDG